MTAFLNRPKSKLFSLLYVCYLRFMIIILHYSRNALQNLQNIAPQRMICIVRSCMCAIENTVENYGYGSPVIFKNHHFTRSIDRSRMDYSSRDSTKLRESNTIALASIVSCSRNVETCPIVIVNQNGQQREIFIFMSLDYYVIHLLLMHPRFHSIG